MTNILGTSIFFKFFLQIIGRAGTGVDNIDIPAASDKGDIYFYITVTQKQLPENIARAL